MKTTQALDPYMENPCPCDSPKPIIPKPSQVNFHRVETPCEQDSSDTRLLVMRLSPRFPLHGQQYNIVIWCTPAPCESDNVDAVTCVEDIDYFELLSQKEGRVVLHDDHDPLTLHWRLVVDSKALGHMCDVLISEYSQSPDIPLELYTPVVKFAAPFCEICEHVDGISWISSYRSHVIRLDELCSAFATHYLAARRQLHALTQSWSRYTKQEIQGHCALPEAWLLPPSLVHIAADASFNKHRGGASALVTSQGDFSAEPASGASILCCELLAIERAVRYARNYTGRVVIWSDSRLALNYVARLNSPDPYTVRNNMTRVLDSIDAELHHRHRNGYGPLVFRWIKAHTDCSSLQRILNDGADRLARHTMRNVTRSSFTPVLAAVCDTIVADCMNNLAQLQPTPCPEESTDETFEHYDIPHDTDSCS